MSVSSLQAQHAARQEELFVGRASQLKLFSDQLALPLDSPARKAVIHLHGQGGMGKSWLLQRWLDDARKSGCITGRCDTAVTDPLALMEVLAESMPDEGYFRRFLQRLATYRMRREEIESDPATSSDLKAALAKLATTGAVSIATGGASDVVGGSIAPYVGEVAGILGGRLQNRSEVALLQDPIAELTPLFVEALNQTCEESELPVILCIDRYESSSEFLDPWFARVLNGEFGETPGNVLICLAGRKRLSGAEWLGFLPLIAQVEVPPMDDIELAELVRRCGVESDDVVERIVENASGMPLVAASMAFSHQFSGGEVEPGAANATAVEALLGASPSSAHKALALRMAVPRELHREDVQLLVPGASEEMVEWLFSAPFIQPARSGWEYHDFVREQFLTVLQFESPGELREIHEKLARRFANGKEIADVARENLVSVAYHLVGAKSDGGLSEVASRFLEEDLWTAQIGVTLASAIAQAEYEVQKPVKQSVGAHLIGYMLARQRGQRKQTLTAILDEPFDSLDLSDKARASLLTMRGNAAVDLKRYGDALDWADDSIALDPTFEGIMLRAQLFVYDKRFDAALIGLDDADAAAQSKTERIQALRVRSAVHISREDPKSAIDAAAKAVAIDRANANSLITRGRANRAADDDKAAIRDFKRAIQISEQSAHECNEEIARTRMNREEYKLAYSATVAALAEEPYCTTCWSAAARSLALREGYDSAISRLQEFEFGDPEDPMYLNAMVEAFFRISAWAALEEVTRDVKGTDTISTSILTHRGTSLGELGRFDDALKVFRSIPLDDENYPQAVLGVAASLTRQGEYSDALEALDELQSFGGFWSTASRFHEALVASYQGDWPLAIEANEELLLNHAPSAPTAYNLAVVTYRSGADATDEFDRARELLEKSNPVRRDYGKAGLFALEGDLTQALPLLRSAFESGGASVNDWFTNDRAYEHVRDDQRVKAIVAEFHSAPPLGLI